MENRRHLIVGIDPGKTGAITTGFLDSVSSVEITSLGSGRVSVVSTIMEAIGSRRPFGSVTVILEQSFILPGTAIHASETYMKHYGNIEAALLASRVPEKDIIEISPQVWQREYPQLIPPRSVMDGRRDLIKHNSRRIAAELFPALARKFARVSDDGRSDSALIYMYGVRRAAGELLASNAAKTVKVRKRRENGKAKNTVPGISPSTPTAVVDPTLARASKR